MIAKTLLPRLPEPTQNAIAKVGVWFALGVAVMAYLGNKYAKMWNSHVDTSTDDGPSFAIGGDRFETHFNIDGTLMLGDFDIKGHPYGVTDWTDDDWL